MPTVNMNEARNSLAQLVQEALEGKEVIIASSGEPLVKIVPIDKNNLSRQPGRFKGKISIAEDF